MLLQQWNLGVALLQGLYLLLQCFQFLQQGRAAVGAGLCHHGQRHDGHGNQFSLHDVYPEWLSDDVQWVFSSCHRRVSSRMISVGSARTVNSFFISAALG